VDPGLPRLLQGQVALPNAARPRHAAGYEEAAWIEVEVMKIRELGPQWEEALQIIDSGGFPVEVDGA
jgi:hypothetical protein